MVVLFIMAFKPRINKQRIDVDEDAITENLVGFIFIFVLSYLFLFFYCLVFGVIYTLQKDQRDS